ncbi:MAG: FHA domain-containing protein [Pseudomonadota bacterium]
MGTIALHLNDARCLALEDSARSRAAPAFAYLSENGLVVGDPAFAQSRRHPRSVKNRFVYKLSTDPLRDQRFSHLSPADLAAALIEDLLGPSDGQPVLLVVPGYFDKAALGVLLGVTGALGPRVVGLVDAAIANSRRRFDGAALVNLELGLHAAVLTLIDQGEELSVARHVVLEDCGIEALRQRWLEAIAAQFVEQSRFDPLHSADIEQLMLDRMPEWLTDVRRGNSVEARLAYGGLEHQAVLDTLLLPEAASAVYQQIADALRALASAGGNIALQLDANADALPGLSDYLKSRSAADVFVVDADNAARGALARLSAVQAQGERRLVRALPPDQATVVLQSAQLDSATADAPTHVLFDSMALELNGEALMVGTGMVQSTRRIALPDGLAGVSQQHCSLHRDDSGCVLADHSRYGTYLNGNRVNGSTLLRTGDVIRVGTPGVELSLIQVVVDHGA